MKKTLVEYLGLAGVHHLESETAQRWGKYFNILMMGAVVWLMFQ